MTDFRALCAELLKGLDENRHPEVRYPGHLRTIMARARAALAQPEPQGLTDWELVRAYEAAYQPARERCQLFSCHTDGLRAVIAADRARWGRPATTGEHQ